MEENLEKFFLDFVRTAYNWWWEQMYSEVITFCKDCPQCAIVAGTGRRCKPPLCPIPIERPFQIFGLDIMELPKTDKGNKCAVVFINLFSKWPLCFDQVFNDCQAASWWDSTLLWCPWGPSDGQRRKTRHIWCWTCAKGWGKRTSTLQSTIHSVIAWSKGLIELLSPWSGSLLLSLENVTFYQEFYCPTVTHHESSGEKPSFLLFGIDCCSPAEAALLHSSPSSVVDVSDYREEFALPLSSARSLATQSIQKAWGKYKSQYDKRVSKHIFKKGEWILIRFPQDESGPKRKLSRLWRGPFRVVSCSGHDIVASKVYYPDDGGI